MYHATKYFTLSITIDGAIKNEYNPHSNITKEKKH